MDRLVTGLTHAIHTDQNIVSVGFVTDALHRLTVFSAPWFRKQQQQLSSSANDVDSLEIARRALDPARCLRPEESLCRSPSIAL